MKRHHILVTGGTGLLALNWACAMRGQSEVTLGTHRHGARLPGVNSLRVDLSDVDTLRRQISQIGADLIVHTAGLTNVDRCEEMPAEARHANAELARNVAEVAAAAGIRLIHVSTDHLFSGIHQFYAEQATPEPLNEYARSKLLAEQWVQQACPDALILRTNFFGWGYAGRQSFSDWIIYSLRAGRPLPLFDDVFITPILADALAHAAHALVDQGASGIFNLVGGERISKYDFGTHLAAAFGLPLELIHRAKVEQAHLHAVRPKDMSLDNSRLRQAIAYAPGSLETWFADLREQERQGRREELFDAVFEAP
ncbi:MAG: SDR family oxidoreductase [Sulfuritalea sp.]|nr:SDR family oxidoreductase [Sulfuritalea sp.]